MSSKRRQAIEVFALWLGLSCCALTAGAQAQDDDLGELDDKPKRADGEEAGESSGDEAPEQADAAATPAPDSGSAVDTGPSVEVRPYAGFGIAMRSFERPISAGVQKLGASAVPGAEVGLGVTAWPAASFSLGFNLAYQTALGFTVTEAPPFAAQNHVRARSEHVALDVAPTWRTGGLSLGVAIGASMRTLWPEAHMLMTPGYSLIGPHARLELNVKVNGLVSLRLAPEAQWITLIDQDLRDSGVSPQGVALGGEASLDVMLSSHWLIGASYRESHAIISTNRGSTFKDMERYMTLRGTGSF